MNTAGTTTFGGAVGGTTPLTSITTDAAGSTALTANVTTTGAQTYNNPVTIGAAGVTLATTDAAVQFNGATTLNGALTVNSGSGAITFGSTIDGGFALTANSTGATMFSGVVGGTTPLASLTTNTGGTTAINTASITTSGNQSYGDAAHVGANATLASTGNITPSAAPWTQRQPVPSH